MCLFRRRELLLRLNRKSISCRNCEWSISFFLFYYFVEGSDFGCWWLDYCFY